MTDPAAYSGLLQYGALGLLALFLGGFLWIQHDRDKAINTRIEREAEARRSTENAMWQLVNATIDARTAETKVFSDLAARTVKSQEDLAAVLEKLEAQLDEHDRRAAERHAQVCAKLNQ